MEPPCAFSIDWNAPPNESCLPPHLLDSDDDANTSPSDEPHLLDSDDDTEDTPSTSAIEPSPALTFSSSPPEVPPAIHAIALNFFKESYDPHRGNLKNYIFTSSAQGDNLPDMELILSFNDDCLKENPLPGVELTIPLNNARRRYIRECGLSVQERSKTFTLNEKSIGVMKQLWRRFVHNYAPDNDAVKRINCRIKKISASPSPHSPNKVWKSTF